MDLLVALWTIFTDPFGWATVSPVLLAWGPDPPNVEPIAAAPSKDDAAIERDKQQKKLMEQRRRGRGASIIAPRDIGSTPAPSYAPALSGRTTLG